MEKHKTYGLFGYRLLWVMILCAAFVPWAFAAETAGGGQSCSLELVYGIVAAVALLMVFGYCIVVKNRDFWFLLLFVSVFIVDLGYFLLAVSTDLATAMMANRVAYLGSVLLPLCMLRIIMNVCHIRPKNVVRIGLIVISGLVFALAASGGLLTLYYKEVSVVYVNGAAVLKKVYGPLHGVYYYYLFAYFAAMVGVIIRASAGEKKVPGRYAALLAVLAFLNIAVWFMEQQIRWEFEFLSVSYVITEVLLLLLHDMVRENETAEEMQDVITMDETQLEKLTVREREVLGLLLENKKRKEIADELFVTENTIKKHTTHIYEKLGVSSRNELLVKLNQK